MEEKRKKGTNKDCAGLLSRTGAGGNPTAFERDREDLLKVWLGAERSAGAFADMRKPLCGIDELVDRCMTKLNCGDMVVFDKVRTEWRKIVNSELAARMLTPVSIRDGVLNVEAANPSFQMAYRDPRVLALLLDRLKEFTGGKVTDVRFVAHGRSGSAPYRGRGNRQ